MEAQANDASWLRDDPAQKSALDALLSDGSNGWITLYHTSASSDDAEPLRYAILSPIENRADVISSPSWDVTIGRSRPGLVITSNGDAQDVHYFKPGDDGFEPIVHVRDLEGPIRPLPELSEDFRLFTNAFAVGTSADLYVYDNAANEQKMAEISANVVKVKTSVVRKYLAARQLDLVLYHCSDFRRGLSGEPKDPFWTEETELTNLEYFRVTIESRTCSRLQGKRIVPAPKIEECGEYPFDVHNEYEYFIVGVDQHGNPKKVSCDPAGLASNYGSNPNSSNFLTPIFFRIGVLSKYYAEPERYKVDDGDLRCVGSWHLSIDNDRDDMIVVFLGDLGQSLPISEQRYWASYNIEPSGSLSATAITRSFAGDFADPESPTLKFSTAYSDATNAWKRSFGWALFKPLNTGDEHVLSALHVPVGDSLAEFDQQLIYLTKLMVDCINEEAIDLLQSKNENDKGISKLERLLSTLKFHDTEQLALFLRGIYGARSKGAAHRKGSDYDIRKIIGSKSTREAFANLLTEAISLLVSIQEFSENRSTESSTRDEANPGFE